MMNEIHVDTNNSIIAQPFDVVTVPQTNISQNILDAAAINTTPKPVNIKIKVKNKEEIARGFGVTLAKFSTAGPKKVRLVSSDQTIISFDLFMETGNEKKILKKTHNKFFELFKPSGCFNNQNDDDVYPYVPSSSNETYRAKSVSQVNDLQDDKICEEKFALKKNLEPMMSTNMTLKTPTFLGKCKPGGCLDPPFSEDKYIYKPKRNTLAINQKLIEKQDLDETYNRDTKHTAKDIDKANINSQDSPSKSPTEKNCSRSLITYPPALSLSDIRDQEETPSIKSKLRTSTENNVRLSINEFSDIYYMPPKKLKSKSNEKLSPEVSENLNVRSDSFDNHSLTGHKKGQKKERISSSKNELYNQATDLNVGNPHMNEICEKKIENTLFNDNYKATVGEMIQIETLKVSSISDVSDTNLDIFEDTVEKKINSVASSQTNIEGTENRETETKIDINVLESNLVSSSVTESSLIFKNKLTPGNLPTIAKDSRISKIESNSNVKLSKLKPLPDKSVDNHLVASQEQNKLPIENQSLRSYRLFNSDETKIKFEPLIPPDEVTLKSSQTAVTERFTDSTKLDHLVQYEESDHLSVQEQRKNGKHKESTYSSIKEQIHVNQNKECDDSLIKEEIQDREYKDSYQDHSFIIQDREHEESDHSSTKKQIQVKEDKEFDHSSVKEQIQVREHKKSDLSNVKVQIQDRKNDNFELSSLKEQTQGKEHKESDLSSVNEQVEDRKYKESYHSSVKEELQDREHKIFDLTSLKEQIQGREYKISDLPSLKDQIQGKEYKESDHSSSKEQIRDKEHKKSDYLSFKEQTRDREPKTSDHSSIKAPINDIKHISSSQPSVKDQIQAREDKGTDHSSVKEELRDSENKISNSSSLKEQIRDIEYKESDHFSVKEQLRDRKYKESEYSSVNEQIQDRERKEFDHSSMKEQLQDEEHMAPDHSSVKEQTQDREREESYHSSMKEQIQVRKDKESDYSSVKEELQDREHKIFDLTSLKEQIQGREYKISDLPSLKYQIQDKEYKESDHSSSKEQIQDKEHKKSDYLSFKEQTQDREPETSDHSSIKAPINDIKHISSSQPSVKDQIQAREDKGIDHSSVKEELRDSKNKISNSSSLKEQIRDIEYEEYDHFFVKEQLRDRKYKESEYSSVKEQIQDRERKEFDHSSMKEQLQDEEHMTSDHSSVKEQTQDREREESYHSSMKEQIEVRKDKESDYSSIKENIHDKENKKSDHASVIELKRDRVSNKDHKVSDHSSLKERIPDRKHKESDYSSTKEQIQDREMTYVDQKELQQNRLLEDVDSHDNFDKQGFQEIIDKNTVQDFATLMLDEAADKLSNNRMSRESSALFQEKINSTLQTQKENNNDLIYYANKTSLATSQIMKLTPTLNSTSTSLTLPAQKKYTIDKTSLILQTQENTNDKHPEYYENKINLAKSQILKLPINLSESTIKPVDNFKIQSSDDVQGLSSIVPIEVQSIKNNDIDNLYGLLNKDTIIEKEELSRAKPQFQTNKSKVTTDDSASFDKKIENLPQMISNKYPDIYPKSFNLNPESYPANSKKGLVKNDKINVVELEEKNVQEKNSFIKINLGFNTYVNDKDEIVIKSFDTAEHLKKDPRVKNTIIKSIIRKNDNGIRIPVNSEIDLTLQIKRTLDIDDTKIESTKKASRKSSDEDISLQETIDSVYENLVPVKNIIRNLKEEAGFLTQQQVLLREMLNTMKTTSMKIINTNNKMCTCNRYSV